MLVLLLVVLVAVVSFYIDSIAKTAVQTGASQATGVKTTVDSISIGILAGDCQLEKLNMANPQGFVFDDFFSLGRGAVDVRLGSLLSDAVDIDTLVINDVDIYLEKKDGKANYQVIIDNLGSSEKKEPSESEGKKFLIRSITVTNVNAHIKNMGVTLKEPIHIDKITLSNFGSESNKALVLADLSSVVLKAVFAAVAKESINLLPNLAGDLTKGLAGLKDIPQINLEVIDAKVQESIDGVVEGAGELGKSTKELGKATEDFGKAADDIGKGLGNLLKPKDKDK